MKKWEYMRVDFKDRKVWYINGEEDPERSTWMSDFLARVGAKGWEAINMFNVVYHGGVMEEIILFKRELNQ